jgi:3-deoxy-manno-octulosonate cytidylyltransferase (CMP-KDO synthetase)
VTLHIVMPARLGSSRLKDKMLQPIGARPLIAHSAMRVFEALNGTKLAADFVIATDSPRIAEAVAGSARVVMTSEQCRTGTDRVAEAAEILNWPDDGPVVNVQADMPFLDPADLLAFLRAVEAPGDWDMLTAIAEHNMVRERGGDFARTSQRCHVGLYAYRRPALARLAALPTSRRERGESLEQLRAVDAGMRIGFCSLPRLPFEINTPGDLAAARQVAGCLA